MYLASNTGMALTWVVSAAVDRNVEVDAGYHLPPQTVLYTSTHSYKSNMSVPRWPSKPGHLHQRFCWENKSLSCHKWVIRPFCAKCMPWNLVKNPFSSYMFLRICMINLAMCILQLKLCSGISTDTIYYSISRWLRSTEFFFSTHEPQSLLIHTYSTKSSNTTSWQDLRCPNLQPPKPHIIFVYLIW